MSKLEVYLVSLKGRALKFQSLIIAIICCGLLLSNYLLDPDLFARLAVGRLIDQLSYIPLIDPFAFTPKKPVWIDHEWLSGYIFYQIYSLFFDPGLFIFKLLTAAITIVILIRAQTLYAPKRTFTALFLSLLILVDCNYIWASTVRSQVFTYLFLSIYLYFFVYYLKSKDRKLFLLMPAYMLLWCNMHGGFVVGLGLHFLFLVFCVRRDFVFHAILFLSSVSVTAINPYGFYAYWEYIVNAVFMTRSSISEWSPLPFDSSSLIPLLVIALSVRALLARKRRFFVYAFYAVALYFAVSHQRHVAIFYFITLVFLSDSFDIFSKVKVFSKESLRVSFSLVIFMFAAFFTAQIGSLLVAADNFQFAYDNYPENAVKYLSRHQPGGKLLVNFNDGSFALWNLYPKFLISLDGRYEELYPDSTVELVSDALNCSSKTQAVSLQKVNPDYILSDAYATCFNKFKRLYRDAGYAVYKYQSS